MAFEPRTFRPLRNNVLIVADRHEQETSSGLIIPKTAQRNSGCMGTVLACGPEITCVRVGDHVAFQSFTPEGAAERFQGDNKDDYYVVKEKHIMAVIEPGDPFL